MIHHLGACFVNGEAAYVHIPKNASTAIKDTLRPAGWRHTLAYVNAPCPMPAFAVVRDPVDRFFSGVWQYALRNDRNYELLLDIIADGKYPVLDEHTQRQSDFILSTFHVEFVRLEDASDYVAARFGLEIPERNVGDWVPRESMVPLIRDFYSDDVALYESA